MSSLRAIANVWMLRRLAKPQMSKEKLANRTLEEQRQAFESIPSAKPPKGTIVENLRIGELHGERLTPPGANPERALLWFHGGGYTMGSPASARGLPARMVHSPPSFVPGSAVPSPAVMDAASSERRNTQIFRVLPVPSAYAPAIPRRARASR